MVPFATALAAGVLLWIFWLCARQRLEPTSTMIKSVRELTRHQSRFYLVVFGCKLFIHPHLLGPRLRIHRDNASSVTRCVDCVQHDLRHHPVPAWR